MPTDQLYRLARAELVPDVVPADLARLNGLRRGLSEAVLPRFAEDGPARQQLQELFQGDTSLGHVCDVLAFALPLPLEMKQALLAEPPENQERRRIKGYYEILCRELADEADVAALLSSLKNYIPYL